MLTNAQMSLLETKSVRPPGLESGFEWAVEIQGRTHHIERGTLSDLGG